MNGRDNLKHNVNIKEEAQNESFTQAQLSEVAAESRRLWLLINHCFYEKKTI